MSLNYVWKEVWRIGKELVAIEYVATQCPLLLVFLTLLTSHNNRVIPYQIYT